MVTLFLVFIITKGALTLYEGNTIERGAVRGGDTARLTFWLKKKMRIRQNKRPPYTYMHTTRGETVVEAYVCNGCVRGTRVRA